MHAHPIRFLELLNGQVQYVVPRWQRRYRWGQSDIERLVEYLLTVADADANAAHYAGILASRSQPSARPSASRRRSEAFAELPLGARTSSVEPANSHL